MSFDELMSKKINPHAVNAEGSSGGTPTLTGNDILLSMVGCDPLYTELKTCINSSTSCNPVFLQPQTEKYIVQELLKEYNRLQKLRYKACKIRVDEQIILAKLAIDAQVEGRKIDQKLADCFEVSRATYNTRYNPTFENFYTFIREKLQNISSVGNKRIE